MRIGVDPANRILLSRLAAPPVRIRHEEQLILREVLEAGEVLVRFLVRLALPRLVGCRQPPSVGDVLAQRETAVDVQGLVVRPRDAELRVLVYEALCTFFEGGDGAVGPPVGVVPVLVVVAACGVECVAELVARDGAKRPVGHVRRHGDVEDGELHYARWEDDFVAGGVVVGVDGGGLWELADVYLLCDEHGGLTYRHAPLVAVDRLAQRGPFVVDCEAADRERVLEKGVGRDVNRFIVLLEAGGVHDVRALSRISNLLDDVVDLVNSLGSGGLVHPFGSLQLLGELGLDVGDDGVAELLGLGGEGLLDEEAAQDPADAVVDVADALAPALGGCVGVLGTISKEEAEAYVSFD